MTKRAWLVVAGSLLAVLTVGAIAASDDESPSGKKPPAAADSKEGSERDADREAIRKASREFDQAFEKRDAKAVAAHWTEQGEYHDESGAVLRGRAAIEKAFAEHFKASPKGKTEVRIESIRFPSRDLAVEEGILRHVADGAELPASTLYSAIHVRENNQWKIAMSREWGADQDRLEDMEWLIGTWQAKVKDQEAALSFAWDNKKTFLVGQFTRKAKGKVISSGNMKIGFDAHTGRLRSWHFEDDGGHGQALWLRDGNRWILDSVGAMGDGTPIRAVNILTRLGNKAITWRSIDRVAGDDALPNTLPIKLTRAVERK